MGILVVDDEEIIREMLSSSLEQAGYEVATAETGEQALEMLRTGSYRLVVTDWIMPGMNGPELCQAIRARHYGRYIYVIVLTSRHATEDIVTALDSGADDFISKPVKTAELCVRVRAGERILALENRDLTILALARLAESRDSETGAHLERIRDYCRVLASDLAMQDDFKGVIDGDYVDAIYATSPLHDIGKVGIPDSILRKQGRYTKEEFEQMKVHTTIGADTLEATLREHPRANFLHIAKEIALCHHERWDGSGYPQGLREEDIPLCARIVAVADVYDALTSKRVYKPAYSHQEARDIIVAGSGTQFDPRIVAAFLRNEDAFRGIQTKLQRASDESMVGSRL